MSTKIKDLIFSESTLTDQQTIKLYQNLDDDRLSDVFSTGVAIDWCPTKLVANGRANPGRKVRRASWR
jgi:hypothetical protein